MKQFSYIFPNGDQYNIPKNSSHIDTTTTFLRGLRQSKNTIHSQLFDELNRILCCYYYRHYSYNYDDFAIFTLGWIKVTSHYKTTFCYAGYDFQYSIISKMYIPNCTLDEIQNTEDYPIKILDLDYIQIITDGLGI